MKVKELVKWLSHVNPEYEVLINDNGSILNTGPIELTLDYNDQAFDQDGEFYILTQEWEDDNSNF